MEKNKIETKNDVEPERATTPDQSPSTKTKLRKVCIVIVFYYEVFHIKNLIYVLSIAEVHKNMFHHFFLLYFYFNI